MELDTKTERSRRKIALSPHAVELLRQTKGAQLARAAEFDLPWNPDGFVFARVDGQPFDPPYVSREFASIVKKAELPHARLHDARHAAASHMLDAGAPLTVVSARLGHANPAITNTVYNHAIRGRDREVAGAYSSQLWGA